MSRQCHTVGHQHGQDHDRLGECRSRSRYCQTVGHVQDCDRLGEYSLWHKPRPGSAIYERLLNLQMTSFQNKLGLGASDDFFYAICLSAAALLYFCNVVKCQFCVAVLRRSNDDVFSVMLFSSFVGMEED